MSLANSSIFAKLSDLIRYVIDKNERSSGLCHALRGRFDRQINGCMASRACRRLWHAAAEAPLRIFGEHHGGLSKTSQRNNPSDQRVNWSGELDSKATAWPPSQMRLDAAIPASTVR